MRTPPRRRPTTPAPLAAPTIKHAAASGAAAGPAAAPPVPTAPAATAPVPAPPAPTPPATAPRVAEWLLPRHPRSASRARERLRAQAAAWHLREDTAETAVLLLSELVANAVRHTRVRGRRIGVQCQAGPDGVLRVEVSDASSVLPAIHQARDDDETGRGLALVVALSNRWGVCPRLHNIGKTVWFECGGPQ